MILYVYRAKGLDSPPRTPRKGLSPVQCGILEAMALVQFTVKTVLLKSTTRADVELECLNGSITGTFTLEVPLQYGRLKKPGDTVELNFV